MACVVEEAPSEPMKVCRTTVAAAKNGVPTVWSTLKLFFIGNSFTYYYDIPKIVEGLGKSLNEMIEVDYVVKGSASLATHADHSSETGLQIYNKLLEHDDYDIVILQEQSTTPINDYNKFLTAVKTLKNRIDQTQTSCQTVLYETWGSPAGIESTSFKSVGEMEEALRTATEKAAVETGCRVNYVGKLFRYIYENMTSINIYADDNRHQNNLGAYISAACHVRSLFNVKVSKCTYYADLNQDECKALLSVTDKII